VVRSPFLVGAGSERERATRIGVARMCVGGSMLVTTGLARRVFGVPEAQDNATLRMLARLFGIRNVVLGVWTLAARDQGAEQRRVCYRLNAVVDATDLGILALGAVTGDGLVRAAVMGGSLGGSALLAWRELLRDAASTRS
jgi:hypothetical protein